MAEPVTKVVGKDIGAIMRDGKAVDRAMDRAFRRVVEHHRRLGLPLVMWRDGRVVRVPADSVQLAEDATSESSGTS
jgi:hypothetical protein